jgi:hypothetical protein
VQERIGNLPTPADGYDPAFTMQVEVGLVEIRKILQEKYRVMVE